MDLQVKYENLEKMKRRNNGKLGGLLVKFGKFSLLEAANEENTKKFKNSKLPLKDYKIL